MPRPKHEARSGSHSTDGRGRSGREDAPAGSRLTAFCGVTGLRAAARKGRPFWEPGRVVQGAREAIPALGLEETNGRRDAMIDTFERPTTVGVRASEHGLELLEAHERPVDH